MCQCWVVFQALSSMWGPFPSICVFRARAPEGKMWTPLTIWLVTVTVVLSCVNAGGLGPGVWQETWKASPL